MSTVYKIPLTPVPQDFGIVLASVSYNCRLQWNTVALCWVLDIYDQNDNLLVGGIPLITGADLLAQYSYLDFGGQLIAQTDGTPDVVPSFTDLGASGNVYFVTSP